MQLYDIQTNGKLKPGALIGVRMKSIGYWDILSTKAEDGYIPDTFKSLNDFSFEDGTNIKGFIVILKYLGNHKFIELLSNKEMILDFASFNFCTDDNITYESDLNNLNYNDEEFEKDYHKALKNPLSPIIYSDPFEGDYEAYVYDGEVRKKYLEETVPKREYITSWFTSKENFIRNALTSKYKQMINQNSVKEIK